MSSAFVIATKNTLFHVFFLPHILQAASFAMTSRYIGVQNATLGCPYNTKPRPGQER